MTSFDDCYGKATARFYDSAYEAQGQLGPDAEFYRSLATETGGPVLELGCGTGRVLLPIARAGLACTGLDLAPDMLAALRAKDPPENLELVCSSMHDFDLGKRRFALVYSAFRAFQHLYSVEEQLGCLACVRRHLAPGACSPSTSSTRDSCDSPSKKSPKKRICASTRTARRSSASRK